MSVTKDDVRYIANLARLNLKDEEIGKYQHDMNRILAYMDQLNPVDTSSVDPLEHVYEPTTAYRPDVAKEPLTHEDALRNAPDADSDYFRVPRVIE